MSFTSNEQMFIKIIKNNLTCAQNNNCARTTYRDDDLFGQSKQPQHFVDWRRLGHFEQKGVHLLTHSNVNNLAKFDQMFLYFFALIFAAMRTRVKVVPNALQDGNQR